jgi:hypothetical protein
LGVVIRDMPTSREILDDLNISDSKKNELIQRYDKVKSGLGKIIYPDPKYNMGTFSKEQLDLIKIIGDEFLKKF